MTNNSRSKNSIPVIAVIVGVIGVCVTVVAFAIIFSPPTSKPSPTAVQPTSTSVSQFQPEIIPLPTDRPGPTQTGTIVPTNTPVPTLTMLVIPTLVSNSELPDLTVTDISTPVCATEYEGTKIRFTIFVKNIGRARTRPFGPFGVDVFLILGQHRYSLNEWAEQFNGVVGSSVTEVFNLDPNDDIKFTVVIDLKGNQNFGIEVMANSGGDLIPEANTTNNTQIKYYSILC